jgi:molybdopterin/thiamine biosynthesis adenylyltransferase
MVAGSPGPSAGIGRVTLVDDNTVDIRNLQRPVLPYD